MDGSENLGDSSLLNKNAMLGKSKYSSVFPALKHYCRHARQQHGRRDELREAGPPWTVGTLQCNLQSINSQQKYDFSQVKEQKIMERLHRANDMIEVSNFEQALVEFNKIIFYDKNSILAPN